MTLTRQESPEMTLDTDIHQDLPSAQSRTRAQTRRAQLPFRSGMNVIEATKRRTSSIQMRRGRNQLVIDEVLAQTGVRAPPPRAPADEASGAGDNALETDQANAPAQPPVTMAQLEEAIQARDQVIRDFYAILRHHRHEIQSLKTAVRQSQVEIIERGLISRELRADLGATGSADGVQTGEPADRPEPMDATLEEPHETYPKERHRDSDRCVLDDGQH